MNTVATLLFGAMVCTLPLAAQEQNATAETTPTAAEAARAEQRRLDAERRAREAMEGKPVVYGGFLNDLRKAESKTRLLSLRQPADPKNDSKHLYLDEKSARPKGFVFFSISF